MNILKIIMYLKTFMKKFNNSTAGVTHSHFLIHVPSDSLSSINKIFHN